MVGGLDEADAGRAARALEQSLHQPPAGAGVLVGGVDAHRPDPGDRAAHVSEAAADDRPVALSDDANDAVQRQHELGVECRELRRIRLDREGVAVRDGRECVVEDAAAGLGVARAGVADEQIGGGEHDHSLPMPHHDGNTEFSGVRFSWSHGLDA